MEIVLKILVPIFTIITLLSKWFRSSNYKIHRWSGFLLQAIPISFWLFYFIVTKQFWICILTLSNIFFVIRGIYNNSKKV